MVDLLDDRLRLTDEQTVLAHKFNQLIEEMSKSGLGLVCDSNNLYLINLEKVDCPLFDFMEMVDEDNHNDETLVEVEDLQRTNASYIFTSDTVFGVRFKNQ